MFKFKSIDIFGPPITWRLQKRWKHKTRLGACFTVLFFTGISVVFYVHMIKFIHKENAEVTRLDSSSNDYQDIDLSRGKFDFGLQIFKDDDTVLKAQEAYQFVTPIFQVKKEDIAQEPLKNDGQAKEEKKRVLEENKKSGKADFLEQGNYRYYFFQACTQEQIQTRFSQLRISEQENVLCLPDSIMQDLDFTKKDSNGVGSIRIMPCLKQNDPQRKNLNIPVTQSCADYDQLVNKYSYSQFKVIYNAGHIVETNIDQPAQTRVLIETYPISLASVVYSYKELHATTIFDQFPIEHQLLKYLKGQQMPKEEKHVIEIKSGLSNSYVIQKNQRHTSCLLEDIRDRQKCMSYGSIIIVKSTINIKIKRRFKGIADMLGKVGGFASSLLLIFASINLVASRFSFNYTLIKHIFGASFVAQFSGIRSSSHYWKNSMLRCCSSRRRHMRQRYLLLVETINSSFDIIEQIKNQMMTKILTDHIFTKEMKEVMPLIFILNKDKVKGKIKPKKRELDKSKVSKEFFLKNKLGATLMEMQKNGDISQSQIEAGLKGKLREEQVLHKQQNEKNQGDWQNKIDTEQVLSRSQREQLHKEFQKHGMQNDLEYLKFQQQFKDKSFLQELTFSRSYQSIQELQFHGNISQIVQNYILKRMTEGYRKYQIFLPPNGTCHKEVIKGKELQKSAMSAEQMGAIIQEIHNVYNINRESTQQQKIKKKLEKKKQKEMEVQLLDSGLLPALHKPKTENQLIGSINRQLRDLENLERKKAQKDSIMSQVEIEMAEQMKTDQDQQNQGQDIQDITEEDK